MKYRTYVFVLLGILTLCAIAFASIYSEVKRQTIHDLNARQIIHARQAARGIQDHFVHLTQTLSILARQKTLPAWTSGGSRS